MWLKKLKKKKLQAFLIGALLFLSALIFASSLSMITSITGYVNNFYSNPNFYNLVLYNSDEKVTPDILQWCKSNSKINGVKAIDAFTSGNDLYRNGNNLKVASYDIIALEDLRNIPYGLNIVKGLNSSICPNNGEVWITQLFADTFNITIGDNLTFKTKGKQVNLKVSALINDSLQPSSTITEIILYTNKNNIQDFSSFTKAPLILFNTKKGVNAAEIQADLTTSIKIGGYIFDKSMLILASTMTSSITGSICTLASLLIFIVSILIIRFILWNNILKEYKSIGIYKALGFSKGEVLKFYIIGYSLVAILGSFLGALCSIPILNYTASKVLKYIGTFNGVSVNFSVIFATTFLFSLVVIINLFLVIKKTNKISPVEAFRTGITSSKKKLTKSIIKDNTSPLALAINDIFKYKKTSVFITLILSLSLFLVLLFGNLNITISKMEKNCNQWFGLAKSDVTINASLNNSTGALNEILPKFKTDPRLNNYIYGAMFFTGLQIDTKKYSIQDSLYNVSVMNSYNSSFGFSIIDGHNPENSNEVSVSVKILKEANLSVGDYMELSMNNKKMLYLISGSFNLINANGYSVRVLSSAVQKEFPNFVGSEAFVDLKDPSTIVEFEKDINTTFPNLNASELHPLMKYAIDPIPDSILPITYLLIVVFIAFSSITILNIILMNMRDNRRNFGIMKALGFSSKEISARYLYRILILTLLSTLSAVTLNLTIAKPMIAIAFSNLDVLIISPTIMLILLTIMIFLTISITLLCLRAIKNTKPNELIEE